MAQASAQYNSERELLTHLKTVHRVFGPGQSSSEPRTAQLGAGAEPASEPAK